ncbi:MAG: hypothetical protein EP332_04240 [Bacteroidetes bacterium]|nr:MAG: hypothetical protein EP332_04240 [Bacteroidota bacterium]
MAFQEGDEVRGKDSTLKAKVLKVLDRGYLMIYELEFGMEMNMHESELVLVQRFDPGFVQTKEAIAKPKNQKRRIDLHEKKLPSNYRYQPLLQAQCDYAVYQLAKAAQESCSELELVHGKGQGVLHQRLMQMCQSHPSVKSLKIQKAALELPHAIVILLR